MKLQLISSFFAASTLSAAAIVATGCATEGTYADRPSPTSDTPGMTGSSNMNGGGTASGTVNRDPDHGTGMTGARSGTGAAGTGTGTSVGGNGTGTAGGSNNGSISK